MAVLRAGRRRGKKSNNKNRTERSNMKGRNSQQTHHEESISPSVAGGKREKDGKGRKERTLQCHKTVITEAQRQV